MKNLSILVLGLLLIGCSPHEMQQLKTGDLLFVSSSISDFESAINEVTDDGYNLNFSHIAMVDVTDSGVFVIEATPKHGVIYRTFAEFKQENFDKIFYIGRLKPQYQQWIPDAIVNARRRVGQGYDFAFVFGNDLYYCSELIFVAFAEASGNSMFFETPPMTFKAPNSTAFLPFWVEYFANLNVAIPEGEPGLNPNGMARSEKLKLLKRLTK
ncbi:MAG: hypothetical protein FWC94_01295 [Bacteroidales bacterium]|nr:hypothetical protein [Bacteroidales bacterium]